MALKEVVLHTEAQAERFVKKDRRAHWDGWDIVVFIPNSYAYTEKRGVFSRRLSTWGFEYRYPVNSEGKWVAKKYVRD